MGSSPTELGHQSNEIQHMVTLTHPFEIFPTEVTNQQYADLAQWAYSYSYCTATSSSLLDAFDDSTQELLKLDDSDCEISFSEDVFTVDTGKEDHPVREVTWYGAVAYCDWLSLQSGFSRSYDHTTWQCNSNDPYNAQGYRLPTEAEWEYACRANSEMAFANGQITDTSCNDPVLVVIGWYCGNNANNLSHPVGLLNPNDWGLYDMHGNHWEWCNDLWGNYGGDVTDPVGGQPGEGRVIRGGSWIYEALCCRSAYRAREFPHLNTGSISFRPVRTTN